MSLTNGDFFPGSTEAAPAALPGQTASVLAEILQVVCTARRTGQIIFRSGPSNGYLFLQQGTPLHAVCGTVEGDEAVYQMLSWPAGTYSINDDILPHSRTIDSTWEQLLLEGANRADAGVFNALNDEPVITANPTVALRSKDSQPKLIVSRGDEPPTTVELVHEYTYLGRADGNELALPEPSISSRHCVFILSGADVVVRDLNSSNGTYVNGEPVTETILRPGDAIQVGVIDIKFVPGVRRPKLSPTFQTTAIKAKERKSAAESGATLKLPEAYARNRPSVTARGESQKDKAFVTGSSAISYEQLAPDAPVAKPGGRGVLILVVLIVLAMGAAAAYFFLYLRR